jgi:predicted nicotinamide N-methyase
LLAFSSRKLRFGRPQRRPESAGEGQALSDAAPNHDRAAFIRAETRLRAVAHVPEIRLHLADEAVPLWQKTEDELGAMGLPPPFWAFAWAGGQALARHLLDHPALVRGRRVLDLGSGSGLVAIAAAKAGAAPVIAAEIDAFAATAIELNAAANDVYVEVLVRDLLDDAAPTARYDTILVGDLFYEQTTAARVLAWLDRHAALGAAVLVGDPGRSYFPTARLEKLADYGVPVTRELEDNDIKRTAVWRLNPL